MRFKKGDYVRVTVSGALIGGIITDVKTQNDGYGISIGTYGGYWAESEDVKHAWPTHYGPVVKPEVACLPVT